jgi:hypothetical protein
MASLADDSRRTLDWNVEPLRKALGFPARDIRRSGLLC